MFPGGCNAFIAKSVERVVGVEWLDLGVPEVLWILEVENFGSLIGTIDGHGNSMYTERMKGVEENMQKVLAKI